WAVANRRELTSEGRLHERGRSGVHVVPRTACRRLLLDSVIWDDADVPHQRALGMRHQETGHGHARLAHFGWRYVIARHALCRNREHAAVEDIQSRSL